jgi:hypothetical protein
MSNPVTQTKTYNAIGVTADKNGKARFHIIRGCRSFPIKRAVALASIEAGCSVYVGSFHDAVCGRGHEASPAELAEWVG